MDAYLKKKKMDATSLHATLWQFSEDLLSNHISNVTAPGWHQLKPQYYFHRLNNVPCDEWIDICVQNWQNALYRKYYGQSSYPSVASQALAQSLSLASQLQFGHSVNKVMD